MGLDEALTRHALPAEGGLERHMAAPGAHRYDRHAHDEFSLIVVTEGRKILRAGRAVRSVEAGQIVVVPPGLSHDCEPMGPSRWAHRCWYLSPALAAELLGLPEARTDPPAFETVLSAPGLARRLAAVHAALGDAGQRDVRADVGQRNGHAEAEQLFLLADALGMARLGPAERAQGRYRSRARAVAYDAALRAALANKLDLDMLAELGGVTRFQVIRDLKTTFDMTPGVYLRDLRLRESKRLLRKGTAIAEVSQTLGFADQSHFSRSFRAAYGMSPLEYRRSL